MAQKKITDLQLISAITDALSVPSDNGIQTYRFTALQLKQWILANQNILLPMLKNDIFSGLSQVTPQGVDSIPIVDDSDEDLTKRITVSSIRNAVYRSVTTTDSVGVDDETMKLSGASFTSTLPDATAMPGKRYRFIHQGTNFTNVYTIQTNSSQTIGGIAGGSYALYTTGEVLEVESDGANWLIVGRVSNHAWTSYTPTFTNLGTVTNIECQWRRVGSDLEVRAKFTTGTTAAVVAAVSLPIGLVSAGASVIPSLQVCGQVSANSLGASGQAIGTTLAVLIEPSATNVNFGYQDNTAGVFTKRNGNIAFASSTLQTMTFRVPIQGWQP